MDPLVQVENLLIGHTRPLGRPIDLTLRRGEIIGLFGPNGAGKSTLLATLLGQLPPHTGAIRRATGLRIRHLPQHLRRPEGVPISGQEWLDWLNANRLPAPPRLAAKLNRRIDRLSGGEFQLLCLWTVLGGDADLVLLDEPTNHLDRDHLELAAEALAAGQATRGALLVSHDREFLQRIATHTIALP